LEHRMKVEYDSDYAAFVPDLTPVKTAETPPPAKEKEAETPKSEMTPKTDDAKPAEAETPKSEMIPKTDDAKPAESPAEK
ncbi:MAG: hypothetical protein NTU83_14275, partial [Candidatus Hydrogenedentes bacterium]|nr:hypothetical protein [Candidatus Hydrogenedentota bacterium]